MTSGTGIRSITFFYPSHVIGGTEFLFIRMAEALSDLGYIVYIIDYENGFLKTNCKNGKVNFIKYQESEKTLLDFDTHLISPLSFLRKVQHDLICCSDVRLFFWCIHPHNLLWTFHLWEYFKHLNSNAIHNLLKSIFPQSMAPTLNVIRYLHDNNGLAFMDYPNYQTNSRAFGFTATSPNYLPIPIISKKRQNVIQSKRGNFPIKIVWLGRLCVDKTPPLLKIMKDANRYAEKYGTPLDFYVIGDGEYRPQVEDLPLSPLVNRIMLGTLVREELDSCLVDVDIAFATGTSCLETAQLGIPSILIDPSFSPVPDNYRYTWLSNVEGYSLGNLVNEIDQFKGLSFSEVIDQYEDYGPQIGKDCYEYVQSNHTIGVVTEKLLHFLEHNAVEFIEFINLKDYKRIKQKNRFSNMLNHLFFKVEHGDFDLKEYLERIEETWNQKGCLRIAIYGGGEHTKRLLNKYDFPHSEIIGVIDSNENKWGKRLSQFSIMSIEDAFAKGTQLILISSRAFESTIYNEHKEACLKNGVELVRLYKDSVDDKEDSIFHSLYQEG
ncbi:glycosyltransferase [Cohnella xylanilytica]|uniref:Glycosyltransferase n=1 Tax=Cohnella xylanilytica TaxID=557555 RepID=A0A841TVK3_9BACL|nr:glycosyltransferase [Cohnella xylanilytica]MBB6692215.1 glycosyltransferase [Cohnella xylanilytica]